ncbi:MAG: ATP-dependent helicase HrpB [Deltaproteobacteria bacterium]|nr:ATP-dependent helicase HrpB [Deltaproteobacteria bacterium]
MPAPLPIDEVLPHVLALLRRESSLVLRAPPGAGKTTRVAPAMLDAGLVPPGQRIIMLQPRRVAARAAARRIARERGSALGEEIGYQIRFEDRTSRKTRLAILTEGLLTRKIQSDPTLDGVAAVILDEFHERSIHADLAIAFLREIQQTVRPELKLVVMSATLDAEPIARFLGGAPIIDSPGRLFPIERRFLERSEDRPVVEKVVSAVRRALRAEEGDDGGDVLVFLPGVGEIRRAGEQLEPIAGDRADVVPLYGDLDGAAQDRAIEKGPRRKIILATNIAETSLTIEGVTCVVDSGLERVSRHDPARGVDRLDTVRISRASADQRSGRAGRTAPGRAYRLWTPQEDAHLPASAEPEVARIDLAPIALEVCAWSAKDPASFGWFEAPPRAGLERAVELLRGLGALEPGSFRVTPHGEVLRRFPLHPRAAAMLIEAHRAGADRFGALAAALISERDVVARRDESITHKVESSDLLLRAERFLELEAGRFSASLASRIGIDADRARGVARVRDRLAEQARSVLGPAEDRGSSEEEALGRAALAGYPDRVAKRRAPGSDRVVMVGGRGGRLAKESVVREAELLVAIELDDSRRSLEAGSETLIRIASGIEEAWLPRAELRTQPVIRWNAEREAVEAAVETRYRDLLLRERIEPGGGDPEAVAARLAEEASRAPERALTIDEDAESLLGRIAFLRAAMPELDLPALDRSSLGALLPSLAYGRRSFAELKKANVTEAIRQLLTHAKLAQLDRHAPERIEVPTGSKIALRYEGAGAPPVLAVRLQELFGLTASPKVAAGRIPVKMELLAPNMRPVQVTQDLTSFWNTTYAEVRRELRARYPKHAWPEDPWTAPPQRGARRRR